MRAERFVSHLMQVLSPSNGIECARTNSAEPPKASQRTNELNAGCSGCKSVCMRGWPTFTGVPTTPCATKLGLEIGRDTAWPLFKQNRQRVTHFRPRLHVWTPNGPNMLPMFHLCECQLPKHNTFGCHHFASAPHPGPSLVLAPEVLPPAPPTAFIRPVANPMSHRSLGSLALARQTSVPT